MCAMPQQNQPQRPLNEPSPIVPAPNEPGGSLPLRFEPHHVSSNVLAPYVWPLILDPRRDTPYLRGLQDRLVDLTVRMAYQHTSWYADTLPEPREPIDIDALEEFPMVSRDEVTKHRECFIANITTFGFASFTSGSTSKPPLMIERAVEEQRYLANMFNCVSANTSQDQLAPLGLVATNGSHGEVFQVPGRGYAFSVNFEQEAGYPKAAWLLQQEFRLPGFDSRISLIQGYFEHIHLLVLYLQQCGVCLPPGLIRSVTCYGMPIPQSRRATVARYFSIQVDDNYSLAEVHGSARYDPSDEAYAYSPMVFAEVVDPTSGRRIESGSGELVVTTLFPFTQRFPLIRYRTDDVVFTPGRVASGPLFRVRGRRAESVELPGGFLLCKEEVEFGLEEESVARLASGPKVVQNSGRATGPSFALLPSSTGGALLRIEIEDAAELELRNRREALTMRLRASVLDKLPADVRELLEKEPSLLSIELIPKGSLR